jgi:hypothetical protein
LLRIHSQCFTVSGHGIDAAAGRKAAGDSRERPGSDHWLSPDNVHCMN